MIARDSPLPSQLAALRQRLGGDWPSRAGRFRYLYRGHPSPVGRCPGGDGTPRSAEGPDVFAPVATLLPEIDGARFALASLSMAAGESHLHVIGGGCLPEPADRYEHN